MLCFDKEARTPPTEHRGVATRAGAIGVVTRVRADTAVRTLRQSIGALLVLFGLLVMYGIAWDSTWHGSVGRDKGFLSPPHLLMYASAASAGLLCIGGVLVETLLYYRRAGVNDSNTVGFLRLFHAPIGLLLSGYGILAMVLAGPLDNYWHSLYGIFINAWHPLHMMGLIGGGIWGLGLLYLWGALLVHARRTGEPGRVEILGFLATATVLMRVMMTISYPGLHVYQTTVVGGVRFMTFPVIFAFATIWLLWIVQTILRHRWSAFLPVIALLAFHLVIQLTVPWIVHTQAAAEGRAFFNSTLIPSFNPDRLAPDLNLLLGALIVSTVLSVRANMRAPSRRLTLAAGAAVAALCWIGCTITAILAAQGLARVIFPAGLSMMPAATLQDGLVALPLTLAAGALSALLGQGIGEILRRNPR